MHLILIHTKDSLTPKNVCQPESWPALAFPHAHHPHSPIACAKTLFAYLQRRTWSQTHIFLFFFIKIEYYCGQNTGNLESLRQAHVIICWSSKRQNSSKEGKRRLFTIYSARIMCLCRTVTTCFESVDQQHCLLNLCCSASLASKATFLQLTRHSSPYR